MAEKPAESASTTKETSPLPTESAAGTDVPMADGDEKPENDAEKVDVQDDATKQDDKKSDDQKSVASKSDIEMKDADDATAPAASETADEPGDEDADGKDAPASGQEAKKTPAKSTKDRRKSVATGPKSKALNKKASRATLTNVDAQPGDLFLVKLKGFPAWPVIIADESMLPLVLIQSRPVSAARPDGTYSEPFADGGKRVHERKLPVMYLCTNEFGWVQNTVLQPLTPEKAAESVNDRMKKDLKTAFELAAEAHDLEYYKELLEKHQEELVEAQKVEEEKFAKAEAKAKAKAAKAAAAVVVDKDGDLDMPDDQPEEEESEEPEKPTKSKSGKPKKRKAEEDVTVQAPQRSEPAKKPKIKLTTSSAPKTTNGVSSKPAKEASSDAKTKSKKASKEDKKEGSKNESTTPDEKKKREILFLRHRLQRGLLLKEVTPKAEEMKAMSEHLAKLEHYPELEAWIIRDTKIHKVLKAIIKLDEIPKESDYKFKERSTTLLEIWNKSLAAEAAAAPAPPTTNGLNGTEEGSKNAPKDKEGEKQANGQDEEAAEKSEAKDVEMTDEKKDEESEEIASKPADKAVAEVEATA